MSLQHDLPPQETEGNLELLVNALQNSAPGAEPLAEGQPAGRNIAPHDTNANNHDVSHYNNVQSHSKGQKVVGKGGWELKIFRGMSQIRFPAVADERKCLSVICPTE